MNSSSSDRVCEIAAALLDEARAGTTRATVTESARRAGVTRPTFYRNHPDAVADPLAHAAQQREARRHDTRQPRPTQHLHERIGKSRQENEELRLHVALYEEHIRRLTIQNSRLSRR